METIGTCKACGKPLHIGDNVVSLALNEEQYISRDKSEVICSSLLALFCLDCGYGQEVTYKTVTN